MYTLDTSELQAWVKRANEVFNGSQRTEIMVAVGRVIGVTAESVIPPYPEQSGKPLEPFYIRQSKDGKRTFKSKFKSAKQQGFVMALIAKGGVPYRRTGLLGKSIASNVASANADSVTVDVGTNTNYSPYVIDQERQSHYHQDNWWTLQGSIQTGMPTINRAASSAYVAEVDRRLRK